jgi:hypothetical protein
VSITDKLIKIEDKVGFLLMIILIAGVLAIVIFSPAKQNTLGSAVKAPISILENPTLGDSDIEQLVRTYFVLSALINIYTNKALGELSADAQKYSRMQKTINDYFACPVLLRNTAEAKMFRNLIIGKTVNSTYTPEINCFEEFTSWDTLKFELLEKQCQSSNYNYGIDANIIDIYAVQRKMLNEGCIMKTKLKSILS